MIRWIGCSRSLEYAAWIYPRPELERAVITAVADGAVPMIEDETETDDSEARKDAA
jgi:hypothetical protein